jgi:Histidine kinase-like ATPase domain
MTLAAGGYVSFASQEGGDAMAASIAVLPDALRPRASELRIEIPRDPAHVRAVRLVAADAAIRAGFDCDDADDLRIAVDEICHALIASVEGDLAVRFDVRPGCVDVKASGSHQESRPAFCLSQLSERILAAVTDTWEFTEVPSEVRFTLRKLATSGASR